MYTNYMKDSKHSGQECNGNSLCQDILFEVFTVWVAAPLSCHPIVAMSKEVHLNLVQNYFSRSNACLEKKLQPQHSECF